MSSLSNNQPNSCCDNLSCLATRRCEIELGRVEEDMQADEQDVYTVKMPTPRMASCANIQMKLDVNKNNG